MRDGRALSIIKAVARFFVGLEVRISRFGREPRGGRYQLQGACNGCGRCCESPAIRVPALVLAVAAMRSAFLGWQRVINGFAYAGEDRLASTLRFTCMHYDAKTKACDSYSSRPYMCRDYPRVLLDGAVPDFFPECGYTAYDRHGAGLAKAISELPLSPEKRAEIERKLFLKKD
jgi:Fe-S-cluster containining protein